MLCDTCRFTGRPGFVRPEGAREQAAGGMIPCPDCGGSGIAHCCDGICAQKESGWPPDDAGRPRIASSPEDTLR